MDSQLRGFTVNLCQYVQEELSICRFGVLFGLGMRHVSNGQQNVRRKGMSFDEKKVTLLAAMQGEALCENFLSSCNTIASKNCWLRSNRTIFKTMTTFVTTLYTIPSHLFTLAGIFLHFERAGNLGKVKGGHPTGATSTEMISQEPRLHASLSGAV